MANSLKFFSIFLFVLCSLVFTGQTIKVYKNFADFEPQLHKSSDTTYVINFWATWCKPCVEEMPEFLEINKKFEKQKFKMILVSLDFDTQLETKVKPFIRENHIQAEVVLLDDPRQNQWIDRVNKDWSGAIPITVIYNKNFYFFHEGTLTFEKLNELITKNSKP